MEELMKNYKIINPDTWNRKSTYLWFSSFANPCYGMDVKIDVTKVLAYSHEHKSSFFINFLFVLVKSLNQCEAMRLCIVNNQIRLYDTINPTYTVLTKDKTFENGGIQMEEDYQAFYQKCHENIESIKEKKVIKDTYNGNNQYNDYYCTCTPWLDYISMTHPIPSGDIESLSVPRICWGKYSFEDDKVVLTLNITVSHALVDGYALCEAFNIIRDNMQNIERFGLK